MALTPHDRKTPDQPAPAQSRLQRPVDWLRDDLGGAIVDPLLIARDNLSSMSHDASTNDGGSGPSWAWADLQDELIVATAFMLAGPQHTVMLSVCRRWQLLIEAEEQRFWEHATRAAFPRAIRMLEAQAGLDPPSAQDSICFKELFHSHSALTRGEKAPRNPARPSLDKYLVTLEMSEIGSENVCCRTARMQWHGDGTNIGELWENETPPQWFTQLTKDFPSIRPDGSVLDGPTCWLHKVQLDVFVSPIGKPQSIYHTLSTSFSHTTAG